jgi:hypothetical protein
MHKALLSLRTELRKVRRKGPFTSYRANLHVHSALSHDSRGTIDEIVAAARAAGTQVLLFTEHPSVQHDFFTEGHRGTRAGVLLIPGAETNGFLAFPTHSLRGLATDTPQEFADLVRRRGGMVFLSHLEERMDWEIRGLTGVEIYNTHADFKDEKALIQALRNPVWIFKSAALFRNYPQEAFSAIQDYPADYLLRWDQLCEKAPHTGVAANDAHQNVGLTARLVEGSRVVVEDGLGKRLVEVDVGAIPALKAASVGKKEGEVLFQIRLDAYEVSLRHVGTHLLLAELSEKGVWEALEAGRAFVAFDWLADASGFDVAALVKSRRHELGTRVVLEDGLKICGQAPLPAQWKVLRNGKILMHFTGRSVEFPVPAPGNYRVEVWLTVAGVEMPWILTNPFYIRPAPNP